MMLKQEIALAILNPCGNKKNLGEFEYGIERV